jgi:hypothetical protein
MKHMQHHHEYIRVLIRQCFELQKYHLQPHRNSPITNCNKYTWVGSADIKYSSDTIEVWFM